MTTKTRQDRVATLWKDYHKSRSTELRNRIVEQYVPLVHKLAEIMARRGGRASRPTNWRVPASMA